MPRNAQRRCAAQWVAAFLCGWFGLLWPHTPVRLQLPPLELDRAAVRAQLRLDQTQAQRATGFAHYPALHRLFVDYGRAEQAGFEPYQKTASRRSQLTAVLSELTSEHGHSALACLRAAAAETFDRALSDRASNGLSPGALGTFPNLLAYHLATVQGDLIAPRFVARTLYKARWNTIHRLPHTEGFSSIEAQAYYGWLALHGARAPAPQRFAAMSSYSAAGGQHAAEAAGVWLFRAGQWDRSVAAFEQAYENQPNLRLAAYLRTAQSAAELSGQHSTTRK